MPGAREDGCVFCAIIAEGRYDDRDGHAVSFAPLAPVVPGHRLVVPVVHVKDALEDALVTSLAVRYAVKVAQQLAPCNIMTSVGAEATQSVFHLHWHVVPRRHGDGLMLPWTEQQEREAREKAAREAAAP